MTAVLTVGGTAITMIEDSFDLTNATDERQRLKVDAIDYTGTLHFQKGAQVVLTDPVLGGVYTGNLNTDKEVPIYPTGAILHSIDCIDPHYYADKRTVTSTITTAMPAGVHVVKQWNDVLKAEGINANAAFRQDTTQTDFNQGVLSGTIATLNVGDGNLELATAGSTVTITENTTANFGTGTLTNMVAANNSLTPTTVSALKLQSSLSVPLAANSIYVKFWTGAFTVGVSDTLNYDLWIASTSPQISLAVDLTFSDGSFLHSAAIVDQNGVSAAPGTDLSSYAKDQWYTRTLTLTGLNGKVINAVTIAAVGTSAGIYTGYIKNCYLGSQSGSPFFSTSATTTTVNPPLVVSYSGFSVVLTSATVVQTWVPNNSARISTAYSIDAVKLLRASTVIWAGSSSVALYASYDGGNTYAQCTNNSALPALPAGSNVSGLGLTLKETFTASGSDPTVLPTLKSVVITLLSAPNATKSDITGSFYNSTTFNTGTYSSLGMASDGVGITLVAPLTRNWNDLIITGQTLFPTFTNVTESAASGAYVMTVPGSTGSPTPQAQSRLDFAGSLTNFTLEFDLSIGNSTSLNQAGVTYRQTSWNTTNNTFAYYFGLAFGEPSNLNLLFGYGSNSSSDSGFTQLASSAFTPSANTTYHVKIVVSGTLHQIYFNGAGSPTISVTDSTYTGPGNIGFRAFGASTATNYTYTWDNFSLDTTPAASGTWTSASTSISSLSTCGLSAIAWTESNTAASGGTGNATALVQTSIDGGNTYQTCTNSGAIASLSSGMNVSGKSLLIKVTLTTTPGGILPEVSRLFWRVLGAYPGSSGTRSTAPLVIDTLTRGNVSGSWGTSNDGQTITQVGTGTTNLTSNEGTIANTTGDCRMVYGARTADSEDVTVRFQISANTMSAGAELRYVDANNLYRLSATQNSLSIIMRIGGSNTTLVTATPTIALNTWYRMRFRATSLTPPGSLFGKVWADDTLESSAWTCSI